MVAEALHVESVSDALVLPLVQGRTDTRWEFRGAAYRPDGTLIGASLRVGPDVHFVGPDTFVGEAKREVPGRAIFLGILHPHFGHFLVESLSRMWALAERPAYDHIVFQVWSGPQDLLYLPFVKAALTAFGIPVQKLLLVLEPTRFAALDVPEQSWTLRELPSPEYARTLAAFGDAIGGPSSTHGRRVYLSRSRLSPDLVRIVNEDAFEAKAKEEGFDIVHPQELSFLEQLRCARAASAMRGFEGSALYLALFMPEGSRLDVITHRGVQYFSDIASDRLSVARIEAPSQPVGSSLRLTRVTETPIGDLADLERLQLLDVFVEKCLTRDIHFVRKNFEAALEASKSNDELGWVATHTMALLQHDCVPTFMRMLDKTDAAVSAVVIDSLVELGQFRQACEFLMSRPSLVQSSDFAAENLVISAHRVGVQADWLTRLATSLSDKNPYRTRLERFGVHASPRPLKPRG